MNEKKRKVFVHDDLCRLPVDMPKAKKHKKSIFQNVVPTIADTTLDPLVEVYTHFRTEDEDRSSDDVIVAILGGAPLNSPKNEGLVTIHKKLAALTPKHQAPKIGSIRVTPADVLMRTKAKIAFGGQNMHHIVFTKQKRGSLQRKPMSHLKGDTYFNDWPVPGVAMSQVPQITQEVFDRIWGPGLIMYILKLYISKHLPLIAVPQEAIINGCMMAGQNLDTHMNIGRAMFGATVGHIISIHSLICHIGCNNNKL